MRHQQRIRTIDTHTEGQATRIVTHGVPPLGGETMAARLDAFRRNHDTLRRLLMWEPRGHRDMYGAILTEPVSDEADFGVFFLHNDGYMDMCGHGTLGLATAVVEHGLVSVAEPQTKIVFETPCGLVNTRVSVVNGRATRVCFQNLPAFVEHLDKRIQVPDLGEIRVDVSWGGNCFVFVDADRLGLRLESGRVGDIVEMGMRVLESANRQVQVHHTGHPGEPRINIATLQSRLDTHLYRNVHVFGNGQFDRSPGGTGTSARLAILHARNQVERDLEIRVQSLTGGCFTGRVVKEVREGDRQAVVTEICGRAHVTGLHEFVVDGEDRLGDGFLFPNR